MIITVSNTLTVENPTAEMLMWCKEHLILANPEYTKKYRMGFYTGKTPKTISLYEQRGNALVLPFGTLATLPKDITSEAIFISDFKAANNVVYSGADVPLYDYQETAVESVYKAQYGILQSPTGSGKTITAIALIKKFGKKALWLTHTADLLNQSKKAAEQYIDKSLIGTITEGKVNVGRGVTFATIQTMCKLDLAQYRDLWDVIVCDECHRVAGSPTTVTMYSKVLNSLAARHKYGLTATPDRADGLIAATFALLGKVIYTVPREVVGNKIVKVSILPRATGIGMNRAFLNTDGTINDVKLTNFLTENVERNELIISDLIENAEHYNLILSDRVANLRFLMNNLPSELRNMAVMVDSSMTSKKDKVMREQAIEDMRQGKKRYLFATYALAREGLDIPRLDRLFMVTPHQHSSVITQSIGRIARSFDGKGEPVVYDYVDDKILTLVKRYKKRCTTYRKNGCYFIEEVQK